jgi:hypothetical protein
VSLADTVRRLLGTALFFGPGSFLCLRRSQAARHEAAGKLVRVYTVQNVLEAVSGRRRRLLTKMGKEYPVYVRRRTWRQI